jgi:hypothetical protein
MSITLGDERFARLVANLRAIYAGACVEGRWVDQVNFEAVGYDRAAPDEGFYGADKPPQGYDGEGWIGTGADGETAPAEPMIPAEWERYTLEEQTNWLSTCAGLAQTTLEMLGEPIKAEVVGDSG